ncbi:Ribosome-binding protein 1, putative [Babesia ovata]|uniref:Ribosome-binding protein 1, putative n=1 Tax=Babesia ovata TaxID=189622 RepID=A0A2H6KDP0_9APIC|nr:Ribosome-binding protein 1, putative [Babesia ovata]GBE61106.1 Ribosome-binding protein 1, putative [Babesia ovata]
MPPQPPTIEPAAQLSHTLTKQPTTMMLDYSNIADITHVTGEDIKTEPNKFPTAEAEEDLTMKVSLASQLQGHPVSTSLQSAQVHSQKVREANELWEIFKKERNERRDEKVKKIMSERENEKKEAEDIFRQKKESGQKLHYADAVNYKNQLIKNLRGGDVYISRPEPTGDTKQDHLDHQIQRVHHEDRSVNDITLHYDPPPLPAAEPLDPIGPFTPADVAFNFQPVEDPQLLPTTDFDPDFIKPQTVGMCPVPWLTQKPTHDSTDIPETELFPAEAPRTVRDMLVWMAGLHNPKHQETLEKCIHNAFKRDDVPFSPTLPVNGAHIRPKHVIDILQLAATFAASVLNAIAPKWRMAVSSVTSTPKDSDQSKDPDCCALLCHLRDYAYASHHQLEFLKSQCSRLSKHGGWQDCQYGHDVSSPKSPLQAFLTDAPASKFKTHPFDPCNICRKSRVNMGFKDEDLPATHETGKHLHTVLSPVCGGGLRLQARLTTLSCTSKVGH